MLKLRECKVCKRETPGTKKRKYCSNACRQKAKRTKTRDTVSVQ